MTLTLAPDTAPKQTAAPADAAFGASVGEELSERQQEVLDAVLKLMVAEGDGFSVAAVARAASCSKETLYKWFGDRDGLLTATVRWQASKVRMPKLPRDRLTSDSLKAALTGFATSWLTVITGDLSIALNRAAVSHAGSGKSRLGEIVLTNGPVAMARRLEPLLLAGRGAGLLNFDDAGEAFRAFFGLVIADTQIRVLLGETGRLDEHEISVRASAAADRFLALFG
ncbi:TetR/AcrR family transcriptional regulator C-terminal domain-containing protein [Hoeflea ulvae]|uniref:TetR/AcrR family transcriptional regulator C-terminal domain-containing protein n=1 Tax=Hoeflea ulvae TaxID=2983764 RepID=A0ABT3YEX5_9HYPH|nr:TetR/AcrR family transcriptional regulator C-terminal domain-containing protein [Hoeflea ulvae]MCY0094398.1 TetR/AcrR family transcriptional regulator C-terminal domain-containing protein [Hoeflea ulvae]